MTGTNNPIDPSDIGPPGPDPPGTPAGPGARVYPSGTRGRWLAVVSVLVVVVAVAVIASLVPSPAAAPAPGVTDGVSIPPASSYSSSAFCTAAAGKAADSTIYLINSTAHAVGGMMTSVGRSGAGGSGPVQRTVEVPARGRAAVNPSTGLSGGSVASSFVFAGGGVVADQIVSGPGGWSMAPCATQASSYWAFAGGSTVSGNALALALFNPAAPAAVVNVSFVTGNGLVNPQAYQGLIVPSGRLIVENVGSYVQNVADIGTVVTVQSGNVVSSEFQQSSIGSGGLALRLGAPSLSSVWRFAQTTVRPGTQVEFDLANPGTNAVTATLSLGLSEGTVVPRRITIPPLSVVDYAASGTGGLPQQTAFSVTINASAPIVAGRMVAAGNGSPVPGWGSSSGTVTLSTRWLVPGPGVPGVPGTQGASTSTLAVANPGPSAARVKVSSLDAFRPVIAFTVPPGGVVVLGPRHVGGLLLLSVISSQPVNVEEDANPAGAPGVVSSTGFPFVGS
jgi:hypothetical protein